jgi:hypothetical protein
MVYKFAPLCTLLLLTPPGICAEVKTIRVPQGGAVPEVVLDAKGVLHMTYGRGAPGNGYYVQSRNLGTTYTRPVQLNQRADTVTTGMERGPKLALGKDGVLHVVWLGYYKKGGGVWYTRSTDGGKTFEAERNLTEVRPAWDNATVTADQEGKVFVFWTGQWPKLPNEDPKSPVASPIIMSRSTDNGKTFAPSQLVKHDYPGRACGCCRLEAQVGPDDALYVGFRGGFQNLRDPYLLKGEKAQNDFKVVRISEDKWEAG